MGRKLVSDLICGIVLFLPRDSVWPWIRHLFPCKTTKAVKHLQSTVWISNSASCFIEQLLYLAIYLCTMANHEQRFLHWCPHRLYVYHLCPVLLPARWIISHKSLVMQYLLICAHIWLPSPRATCLNAIVNGSEDLLCIETHNCGMFECTVFAGL